MTPPPSSGYTLLVRILDSSSSTSTAIEDSCFTVTASQLLDREDEMRQVADCFDVSTDRWTASRLFEYASTKPDTVVSVNPAAYCRENNLSHRMRWKPWLTTLLQDYYRTGSLRVDSATEGDDLLLCLEFFGILYQPNQLIFDSYQAYQTVKEWSDYLSHRAVLAEFVAEQWLKKSLLTFRIAMTGPHVLKTPTVSASTVCRLFRNADMRQDFALYLQNVLPQASVNFSNDATPVLSVLVDEATVNNRRTKSALPYPIDEYIQEEISNARLEELVENVHKRKAVLPSPRHVSEHPYHHQHQQQHHPWQYETSELVMARDEKKEEYETFKAEVDYCKTLTSPTPDAPLRVIRARSGASVTSALTGPFFLDEDGKVVDVYADDQDARAQALRHEWIQGSFLNRDISTRVKALLDDEQSESMSTTTTPNSWDWISTLCNSSIEAVGTTATSLMRNVELNTERLFSGSGGQHTREEDDEDDDDEKLSAKQRAPIIKDRLHLLQQKAAEERQSHEQRQGDQRRTQIERQAARQEARDAAKRLYASPSAFSQQLQNDSMKKQTEASKASSAATCSTGSASAMMHTSRLVSQKKPKRKGLRAFFRKRRNRKAEV